MSTDSGPEASGQFHVRVVDKVAPLLLVAFWWVAAILLSRGLAVEILGGEFSLGSWNSSSLLLFSIGCWGLAIALTFWVKSRWR